MTIKFSLLDKTFNGVSHTSLRFSTFNSLCLRGSGCCQSQWTGHARDFRSEYIIKLVVKLLFRYSIQSNLFKVLLPAELEQSLPEEGYRRCKSAAEFDCTPSFREKCVQQPAKCSAHLLACRWQARHSYWLRRARETLPQIIVEK